VVPTDEMVQAGRRAQERGAAALGVVTAGRGSAAC
jgi:hypothetical protein